MFNNPSENPSAAAAAAAAEPDEESLRQELRESMKKLRRREPLDPSYKRFLMNGLVSKRKPVLPKDKMYKRIGSDLRSCVETFVVNNLGKDPFDKISQRQPLQEEHMRAALTLREAKQYEQKSLLEVTLSAVPRRNGMDAATRKRHLEGIALGLQSKEISGSGKMGGGPYRSKTPPPPTISQQQTEKARRAQQQQQVELDRQKLAQAKAREEARQQEERQKQLEDLKRKKKAADTPQTALYRIYYPIFKKLWEMEFVHLGNTNPFRMVIDRDNCASVGAPDYFDVIDKPMNLTYMKQKVEKMEYVSLQAFFQDVELILANAMLYNSDTSNPYRIAAEEMKKSYRKIAKKVVQTLQKKQKQQQQQQQQKQQQAAARK